MQAQKLKANNSNNGMFVPLRAKILYFISLMTGILGTYFSLRSQTEETDMPSRVLYSMTLMVMGMLLEAAEISESSRQSMPPSTPKQAELSAPLLESEESSADVEVMENEEILSHSYSLNALEKKDHERIGLSSSASPTGLQWSFKTGLYLFSSACFGQALSLFIRNAIQESASSSLLPYTTLIGFAAGYLFHVSLKPWRLWGIRDWIQTNRNVIVPAEVVVFYFLPPILNQDLSSYYYLTAAFWSGYNLHDLIFAVTKKLLGKNQQNIVSDDTISDSKDELNAPFSNRANHLLTSISGSILITVSILLLKFIPKNQAGFRNIYAQILGSIGCYALTYPLGIYLGHKISSRYYEDVLAATTYLLIPFASPDLSILHYLAMTGAGICGGISHHITHSRYKNHLATMQHKFNDIQQIMSSSPQILQQLLELPLPIDILWLENRKKKFPLRLIQAFSGGSVLISSLATQSLWKKYPIMLSSFIGGFIYLVMGRWILPRYSPSIYDCDGISWLSRFSYATSFTQAYIAKIISFICLRSMYDINGNFLPLQKSIPNEIIFSINLYSITAIFYILKGAYKFLQGGYIPYFPSSQEIDKLRILAQQNSFESYLKSTVKDQPLTLNYHLLQFMKKNIPLPSTVNTTLTPVNNPNTCSHSLQHLSLFAIPLNLSLNTSSATNQLTSLPLATLHCQECKGNVGSLHTNFNAEDKQYTEKRFDASFEIRAGDASFRGNALALQFQFGLPPGLGLTEDISRFSI